MKILPLALTFIALACSCAKGEDSFQAEVAAEHLINPGIGIGGFEIGVDTLQDILGSGSSTSRDRFLELGLEFKFEQGIVLTGVRVFKDAFSTSGGLRVGDSAEKIEEILGPPLSREVKEKAKGLEFPALVYEGIVFFLEEGKVWSISVG